MTRTRRFAIGGIAVGLAMLASACTGGGGSDPEPTPSASQPTTPPDALPEAWAVPMNGTLSATPLRLDSGLVTVAFETDGLIAYAADTGKEAWRLRLPDGGKPCAPPGPANEAGLAAVVFRTPGADRSHRCTRVAVVDIRGGTLLWHNDFSGDMAYEGDIRASIGPTVLTVQLPCGELRRFDARTHAVLPTFLTANRACEHSAGHNARHVLVAKFPDDGTPEVVPGWRPSDPNATAELALYDAETGAKLWGRPMAARGLRVNAVVSSDPLVVDLTVDDERMFRVFDDKGNEVRTLGNPFDVALPPPFDEQIVDGVWLEEPQRDRPLSAGLPAYDLATARDLPGVAPGAASNTERIIGISHGRLVTTNDEFLRDPATGAVRGVQLRVITYDLRTGERKDVGQMASTRKQTLVHVFLARGDFLFVETTTDSKSQLVALRLPA